MRPEERLDAVITELEPLDLEHRRAERIRRRARAVFARVHRTPSWLRWVDTLWDRAEPALVAGSTLWMLAWAAAVVAMVSGA